ncbi:hypothetical protein BaRGS_00022516 [Batillaria attramentaria]|uniref:Uncharacterized protein n=1 Tax=Batillaria attramentaria TaxID=370345 RepID=A0ABD0KG94_9CAEN
MGATSTTQAVMNSLSKRKTCLSLRSRDTLAEIRWPTVPDAHVPPRAIETSNWESPTGQRTLGPSTLLP